MDTVVKRDIRLVNVAGAMGTVYWRLGVCELLLLFVTRYLKIPKETWALVASVIPVTGVFYLVSAYLAEHLRRRKLLSLSCLVIGRLAVPAIMLLPFIAGEQEQKFRLFYLAAALITHASLSAIASSAWLSWVADIVPSKERGRFYSARLRLITLVDAVMLVSAGRLLDVFGQDKLPGYLIIFGFAFLVGELDLLIHSFVRDRPMPEPEEKIRLLPMLAAPWRHVGFRNLMVFRMIIAFSSGIFGPFIIMYRIEELGMSVSWVCGIQAFHMLVNVMAYGFWRKIGERVGYRTVYIMCQTVNYCAIVYWFFLPQGRPEIFLTLTVLAQVWHGTAWAGSLLASSTLTMDIAPEKHRSMYFAQVTMVLSLMMGLGIFCGRWVFIHTNPLSDVFLPFVGTKLTGVHVLIGLHSFIGLFALRVFGRRIPDAKAEAAMPRIGRILRTNPIRILPTLLPLERPLSPREKEEHVGAMRSLVGGSQREELHASLDHVLDTPVGHEDELHGIIGKERAQTGRGVERMLREIGESAALHLSTVRARAAVRRIQRLYEERDLLGCLRAVRRLARQTAERLNTPKASAAFNIIEAIVEVQFSRPEPHDAAVLLAVYAYLQMVREPESNG